MGTKTKSDSRKPIAPLLATIGVMLVWVAPADGHTDVFTDKPQGVPLSDREIQSALDNLDSGKLPLQLQATERLALYFGRTLNTDWQTRYRFSHAPSQKAYKAMHKPRPISLLLACLKQKAPLVRTWAIRRLRIQVHMSNTTEQKEKKIRMLLAIGGLVSASNRPEITDALKLRLKDSDAGTRAEALVALNALGGHDTYGRARLALRDAAPKVRSTAWGLLAATEKRNYPPR